jgi:hypothetical protein
MYFGIDGTTYESQDEQALFEEYFAQEGQDLHGYDQDMDLLVSKWVSSKF